MCAPTYTLFAGKKKHPWRLEETAEGCRYSGRIFLYKSINQINYKQHKKNIKNIISQEQNVKKRITDKEKMEIVNHH